MAEVVYQLQYTVRQKLLLANPVWASTDQWDGRGWFVRIDGTDVGLCERSMGRTFGYADDRWDRHLARRATDAVARLGQTNTHTHTHTRVK